MSLCFTQVEIIKKYAGRKVYAGTQVCLFGSHDGDIQRGFTLIELIMTMVIIGILAVAVVPRFVGTSVFQSRGFADQVQATLRYAQKEAIAQHRNVCVAVTASAIGLKVASLDGAASACDTNLVLPGQTTNIIGVPSASITLSPAASFNFDALGSTPAKQIFTISGATNNIVVEAQTGYVHSP
jgi:MSHA pilin protein MshC